MAGMGPLEKSLRGRSPNGKSLSEKQLKEVQDIDRMLGDMGKFGGEDDSLGGSKPGGSMGSMGGGRNFTKSRGYGQDRNSDVD